MFPSFEDREQRMRLAQLGVLLASLGVLGLVAWLHTQLRAGGSAAGAVVASQAEPALWGLGAFAVGMFAVSFFALRKYDALKDRALYDHLTKSANRHYLQELLHREVTRAREEKRPLAVMMMDLDHFKHYNDTNGHLQGDRLLQEFAALLKNHLRTEDVLGRYGGEEFILVLPDTTEQDAFAAAKRMCALVHGHPFEKAEGQPNRRLTVSVGVASLEEGMTPVDLVRRADEALYQAKRSGRDCAVLWNVREKLAVAMHPAHAGVERRGLTG